MNTIRLWREVRSFHGPMGLAVREHVDSLERKALIVAPEVQDALGPQQVPALSPSGPPLDPPTEPLHRRAVASEVRLTEATASSCW